MIGDRGWAVVGADRFSQELADRCGPTGTHRGLGPEVRAWAPGDGPVAVARAQAQVAGAPWMEDAAALAMDRGVSVVYLAGVGPARWGTAQHLLGAGKVVAYRWPLTAAQEHLRQLEEAARAGGGALFPVNPLRLSPVEASWRQAATQESLGTLHAAYAALRWPQVAGHASPPPLEGLALWLWDWLSDLTDGLLLRVHGAAGPGTGLATVRGVDGWVASLQWSVTPGPPEAELDLLGSRGALRVEPFRPRYTLEGEAGQRHGPVRDLAWDALLDDVARVVREVPWGQALARRQERALSFLDLWRRALERLPQGPSR